MQRHLLCLVGLALAILPSCAQQHSTFYAALCAPAERCGGELTCVDSLCVRVCEPGALCPTGESCVDGLCRPPNSGDPIMRVCAADGECPGDGSARCVGGVCTFIDGQTSPCSSDAACGDPAFRCADGFCTLRDLSAVGYCFDDGGCPSSHVCLGACDSPEACTGVCVPREACAATETCANGVDDDCNGVVDDCACPGDVCG